MSKSGNHGIRPATGEGGSCVGFSPDGKWLATTGGGLRLWGIDSWQPGVHVGGGGAFAFSPDSKLVAVETGKGAVRLVDPDTGREYARLEDPNQARASAMCFSPDGTQLVTTNNDSHAIHVWNLRLIRKQLAKMELDWELPAYPPATMENEKPLLVEIDLGELAPKFTDKLWQDLFAGKEKLHRFIETKHDGTLNLTSPKQVSVTEMKADAIYVLDLESKAFDTFLTVEDRNGIRLAFNDDISAGNLNPRLIFTAPMAGNYRIITTPYVSGSTGPYLLRIRELVKDSQSGNKTLKE